MIDIDNTRTKRSLIPFVSNIANYSFGTATKDSIGKVNKAIKKLAEFTKACSGR